MLIVMRFFLCYVIGNGKVSAVIDGDHGMVHRNRKEAAL